MGLLKSATCCLCAIAILAVPAAWREAPGSALSVVRAEPPAADEVRGLWVTRSSLSSPRSIEALVRAAESGGFNTLLVQVRGRGEAYYQSAIEPRAPELDGQPVDFDPLAMTLALARRAGLRVHAWVNIDLVSSAAGLPRSRDHVVLRHPDWLMVPKALAAPLKDLDVRSPAYVGELARWTRGASATVEGLYLSPISPEAQAYTVRVVEEIVARYAVDGVHFDYARYPNALFDYSARALSEFRATKAPHVSATERQRLDAAAAKEPAAWTNMFPESWGAFRRDRLTMLVQKLHAAAKTARPGVIVSAAVQPNPEVARTQLLQDWSAWASSGLLDVICPMAYSSDAQDFSDAITRAKRGAGDARVWVGIGAWQLPVNRAVEHVQIARRAGASGVLLFSYDALAASAQPPTYFAGLKPALLGTAKE
jgi:uncharacterized lipoprotein YddW (UPF0748 family)